MHPSGVEALCFSPGGRGAGKCTKVPTLSCCPQHPGESGIWAELPFIAAHQHQTPPTPTLAPQGDPGQGGGRKGKHCLEKDSTRIQ